MGECDQFFPGSRRREICEGKSGLPVETVNRFREMWGMEPLTLHPDGKSYVARESDGVVVRSVAAPASGVTTGGCCGEKKSVIDHGMTAAKAFARWTLGGFAVVPEDVAELRMSTCRSCPRFNEDWCGDCGCYLPAKTKLPAEACPAGKWLQSPETAKTITGDPSRNLIYHLWPKIGNSSWQWNLDELKSRIGLFDGVRSIAVVTDDATDSANDVREYMSDVRIDNWIELPNNAKIREGQTFFQLMETLPRDGNSVTFYGHGKGVRHHAGSLTKRWAAMQYEVCLDDYESVRRGLGSFPMVGAFKRYGQFKFVGNHQWHYSGTNYWFRNADVFLRNWRRLQAGFFAGVEAWPANIFEAHETGCLFGDDVRDLYQEPELAKWESKLIEWRKAR